jgi:hypothetical protein
LFSVGRFSSHAAADIRVRVEFNTWSAKESITRWIECEDFHGEHERATEGNISN